MHFSPNLDDYPNFQTLPKSQPHSSRFPNFPSFFYLYKEKGNNCNWQRFPFFWNYSVHRTQLTWTFYSCALVRYWIFIWLHIWAHRAKWSTARPSLSRRIVIWLEQIKVAHINLHTNARWSETEKEKSFTALRPPARRNYDGTGLGNGLSRGVRWSRVSLTTFLGTKFSQYFFPSNVVFA